MFSRLWRGLRVPRQVRSATYRLFNNRQTGPRFPIAINRNYAIAGGVGLAAIYVTHLEQAPITGRTRFMCVGEQLERWVGDRTYRQVLAETHGTLLPDHHPETVRVRRIMLRLVAAAQTPALNELEWKVHVVADPKAPPNAFVLPGGKVFVFLLILGLCGDDDGLATVLSHELLHQLARHTAEQLSKAPFYLALGLALYTVTGSSGINNLLIDLTLRNPALREMETEADHMGLVIMLRACFNPQAAIGLWQRMAAYEQKHGGSQPEFLSTHPASRHRIDNMREWMPEAERVREEAGCGGFTGWDVFR